MAVRTRKTCQLIAGSESRSHDITDFSSLFFGPLCVRVTPLPHL
jgi:hypothetical protein